MRTYKVQTITLLITLAALTSAVQHTPTYSYEH